MRKFGTLVRTIPYRDHFIEIRQGKILYRAYILDKYRNLIAYTPLSYEDSPEFESIIRTRVDEIVDGREHVIDNPMG